MGDEDSNVSGDAAQQPEVSPAELQFALDKIRSEQNLSAGVIAGLVAALAGAGIWALATALSEYQIGWMAIGVGFVVGYAVRIVGKGIDQIFGIVGGVLSVMGCAMGNLLTMTYFISAQEGVGYMDTLSGMTLDMATEIMVVTFSPMDIVFYGIAIYFGYRYAFRQVTEAELTQALGKAG